MNKFTKTGISLIIATFGSILVFYVMIVYGNSFYDLFATCSPTVYISDRCLNDIGGILPISSLALSIITFIFAFILSKRLIK